MIGKMIKSFSARTVFLCLLLTPGIAHGAPAADQSQQIQQILSKIVASDAARGDRIEITLANGVLIWKFEAHSCFQAIYRATLSELDLPKSALVSNPEKAWGRLAQDAMPAG
jgi:hypothetical protein